MAPISTLLFLITVVQFTKTTACPHKPGYLRPRYSADIVTDFPPLSFPGLKSSGDISGIQSRLSIVAEQIKWMGNHRQAAKVAVSSTIGLIPYVGGILETTTGVLADHLMSVAHLEGSTLDLKIKLGIQEALARHSLSHLIADVKVLGNRVREITGNFSMETKRTSVQLAVQVCERILVLFSDETYLFWEVKLVFFPYLMSFTGLYATVAAAAAELIPGKVASLQKDMVLLRTTILKYQPWVKQQRLNMLSYNDYDAEDKHYFKPQHLKSRCPNFYVIYGMPSSPFPSCIRGEKSSRVYSESEQNHYVTTDWSYPPGQGYNGEGYPSWFEDTVTGAIYCGWHGCWNSLYQYIGNAVDKLTDSAVKSIPIFEPAGVVAGAIHTGRSRREEAPICEMNAFGRLEYLKFIRRHEISSSGFGCHKGYCWRYCERMTSWCYTRTRFNQYARCDKLEDCCAHWACHSVCSDMH